MHNSREFGQIKIAPDHDMSVLLQDAYQVFAPPKPDDVEVCTYCCMDTKIASGFFDISREELPLSYIQNWFSAAFPVGGISKQLWTYLLPRILELLALNEEPGNLGLEASLDAFETGNPEQWSNQQWQVLDQFQRFYLQRGFVRRLRS